MPKITYTATAPNGQEITRKSARTYTHAVLVTTSLDWAQRQVDALKAKGIEDIRGYYAGQLEDAKNGRWGSIGFCGRRDLAEKLAAGPLARHGSFDQVIIVEVTPDR